MVSRQERPIGLPAVSNRALTEGLGAVMPNGLMSVTELRGLSPISPAARRSSIGAFLSPAFYIVYNLTIGALSDSFVQWALSI